MRSKQIFPSYRPLILLILAAILGMAAIPGCWYRPESPMRLGANTWTGNSLFFLAEDKGYYGKAPVRVVEYASSEEIMRSFKNGAIEAASLTSSEVIQLAVQNQPLRMILILDFSRGADAILAQPQFKRMRDLRGRRVGVESQALGIYVLSRALELSGMTMQDIKAVPLPLFEHLPFFEAGKVDALVTFEPRRSILLAKGAHELFNSSEIPGEIADCLIVREDAFQNHPKAVQAVVDGWFKARAFLVEHPREAAEAAAPTQGQTPEAYLKSLAGLSIPSLAENVQMLGEPGSSFPKTLGRTAEVMYQHGFIAKKVDVRTLLDPRLLRKPSR